MNREAVTQLISKKEYKQAKAIIAELLKEKNTDIELQKLQGLCNINLGCWDEAFENFIKLVEIDNEDALSLYYLSTIYIEKNNLENAEKSLNKVIELRENYLDAYKSLAIVYMKQKKFREVFTLEEKLLSIGAEDIQVFDILSAASLDRGRPDLAVIYLKKAIELEPNNPKIHNKMGLTFFALGKMDDAISEFNTTLSIEKDVPSVLYNLGLAYFAKEEFKNAFESLKKSYEVEKREQTLTSLALSALKAQENEAAINYYEELIKIHPDKENFKYNLACAYDGSGDFKKAAQIIEKLLTFNLNAVQLKLHLASLYSRMSNIEGAKILYSDLIKTGVVNENILYEYGVLCAKSDETDKAEDVFKKIISMNPQYALAYKDLAIIYLTRKFFDRAEENFKKAYKLEPDNIFIIFEYASYFHLMSNFEEAKKLYNKLLKLEAIPEYMYINIAVNYITMNMIDKAKDVLLKAIKIAPQDTEILFQLAKVYFLENNFENAKQLLEDAYAIAPNTENANLLAKSYLETGDYNQAYALFNIINLAIPNNITVLLGMATCKYKQKEYTLAKEHIETILKVLPEHEDAVELLNKITKEEQ